MSARNSDGARSWASAAQAQTEAAQAAGADVAEDGAEAAAAAAEVPQALSFPEVEAEGGVWVATYAPDLHSGVAKIIAKDTLSAALADKRIQFPEVLRNGGGAATEIGPVAARISTKNLPEMRKEGWIVTLTGWVIAPFSIQKPDAPRL